MKKAFQSFITFTRNERMGFVGLLILLLVLILLRSTMHLWFHPRNDSAAQNRIEQAWQDFKKQQLAKDSVANNADTVVDLNTADSIALINIDYIGPVLAHRILEKRRAIGDYKQIDQLLDIPRFPAKHFEEIKKHLIIKPLP